MAAPPGEPAPLSLSNGGGAGRCVAWRCRAGRGNRPQPLSGQSWWRCGGGSLRVCGAEPVSGPGGGEGSSGEDGAASSGLCRALGPSGYRCP